MKKIIYIITLLFISYTSFAQSKIVTVGLDKVHLMPSCIKILASNDALIGSDALQKKQFVLTKIGANQSLLWSKILVHTLNTSPSYIGQIIELPNKNIVFIFNTEVSAIVCINPEGDVQWAGNLNFSNVYAIAPTTDGILLSEITSGAFIYAKLGFDGNVKWAKQLEFDTSKSLGRSKIALLPNGDFVLAALRESLILNADYQAYLFKINGQTGTLLKSKEISNSDTIVLRNIKINQDGTLFLNGNLHYEKGKRAAFYSKFDQNLSEKESFKLIPNQPKEYKLLNIIENSKGTAYGLIAETAGINTIADVGMLDLNMTQPTYLGHVPYLNLDTDINTLDLDASGSIWQVGPTVGAPNILTGIIKTQKIEQIQSCTVAQNIFKRQSFSISSKDIFPIISDINLDYTINPNIKTIPIITTIEERCFTCAAPQQIPQKQTICEGDTFKFNNKKYFKSGVYFDTLKTSACKRIYATTLKVQEKVTSKITNYLCKTQPSIKIAKKTYTLPGTYNDTLKTKAGCDSILLITIKDLNNLSVSLGDDQELFEGEQLLLFAQTTPPDVIKQYTWFPSGTTACDTCQSIETKPTDNQWYAVLARQGECTASDTLLVRLLKEKTTYLPNAFSPNGDQNNDLFRPFCADVVSNINAFEVFDRWGNLLYRKTNFTPNTAEIGWDGTFRGSPSTQGVYTYRVEVQLKNGKIQQYVGDVLLLR